MRRQIHRLSINDLLTLLETLHTNNIYSSIPIFYIYIQKHSFRMQQIHVDTLAEWHQFSLDNAAFQSIPYKIILHRFAIILCLMLSSRTEHSKKYQKPWRSICNVPMFAAYRIRRNNGNEREGKKCKKRYYVTFRVKLSQQNLSLYCNYN